MSIRQLNATYSKEEDRVLFRFTTVANEEFRLWLTRARVAQILALGTRAAEVKLEREDHIPSQAKAIAEFRQQAVQQNTPFTEFEPAAQLPLGEVPPLVLEIQMSIENELFALQMKLSGGKTLTMRLTEDLLGKLRVLLEKITQSANWGLVSAAPSQAPTPSPESSTPTPPSDSGKILH